MSALLDFVVADGADGFVGDALLDFLVLGGKKESSTTPLGFLLLLDDLDLRREEEDVL